MKLQIVSPLLLLASVNACAQQVPEPPKLPAEIRALTHKPLMVSDLPQAIASQLKFTNALPQATGHTVHDHSVVLIDKNGKKIKFADQLQANEKYTVDSSSITPVVLNNIWFFSPNGEMLDENSTNVYDDCTYERPCSNITQQLIDGIHAHNTTPKIWMATGAYSLPQNVKQHGSQILRMYGDSSISGRSSDFMFKAYNEERPELRGTLSWNDYRGHWGVIGQVQNIRSLVSKNPVELEELKTSVNFHSTGWLVVEDVDADLTSHFKGVNVIAQGVSVVNSNLSCKSEEAANISSDTSYADYSKLVVEGHNTANISMRGANSIDSSGWRYVVTYNSSLVTRNESCRSFGIVAEPVSEAYIISTQINMSTSYQNPGEEYCQVAAIYASQNGLSPWEHIVVYDSEITVNNSIGNGIGIVAYNGVVQVGNSTIDIHSSNHAALGVLAKSTEFFGSPSTLSVSSPAYHWLFDGNGEYDVLNNSSPASQCQINDEAPMDCNVGMMKPKSIS